MELLCRHVRRSRVLGHRFAVECLATRHCTQRSGNLPQPHESNTELKQRSVQDNIMSIRKKIEVFSAGCSACKEAIELVKRLAGSSHEVEIHDINKSEIASRAKKYGIRSVPAVVIEGKLASCCAARGLEEHVLRSALA